MHYSSLQRGFTLIEIAIVLTIVGLLMGTAVKGTSLVRFAQLKQLSRDFTNTQAHLALYRTQYKSLPGDDARGAERFGIQGQGNGNGQLEGTWRDTNQAYSETRYFWTHLKQAGLSSLPISEQSLYPVANLFGGQIGVQSGRHPPISQLTSEIVMCSSAIPGELALALDERLDDGQTDKGKVMMAMEASGHAKMVAIDQTSAAYDPLGTYVVCMALN